MRAGLERESVGASRGLTEFFLLSGKEREGVAGRSVFTITLKSPVHAEDAAATRH